MFNLYVLQKTIFAAVAPAFKIMPPIDETQLRALINYNRFRIDLDVVSTVILLLLLGYTKQAPGLKSTKLFSNRNQAKYSKIVGTRGRVPDTILY